MSALRTVGAWATRSALADPQGAVRELQDAGVNLCSIMVNSIPEGTEFSASDPAKIIELADACHAAGIEVTLTSWIRPYRTFVEQAAEQLGPIMSATGATLLVWDAEEPWMRAPSPRMGWDGAAELVAALFAGVPMGLTAIGSVSAAKLGALAQVCGIWMPQAYATTRGGSANPERVVEYCLTQWRKHLGEPSAGWCVGLAAYDQPSPPASAMQETVDDVLAAGIDGVCYWSANAIARDPAVREFVAGLRAAPEPELGVMPTLILDELEQGRESWPLLRVQGLLSSHGYDPGPLDGLIGPRTHQALTEFQGDHGGAVGCVDGNTWLALLGP